MTIGTGTGIGLIGALGEAGDAYIIEADAYTVGVNASTFTIVDDINAGVTSGEITVNGTLGTITINKTGTYQAVMGMSFSLNGGDTIEGAFFVNGVESTRGTFERDIANVNDVGSVSATSLFAVTSGDLPFIIDFRLKSISASRITSIQHFSANITGVGI